MRLLIISHTPHYRDGNTFKGWGPTLREIDHLATLFSKVVHIAPLYETPAPSSALPYEASHLRFRPVKPAGGDSILAKAGILFHALGYIRAMLAELPAADIIHVRCPANISLIAILLLALIRRPAKRWIKYAGNWMPDGPEARSYAFQRWWLRHNFSRAKVTVNGFWPGQPAHIHAFLNPCLTGNEIEEGRLIAQQKRLASPIRLLYVGNLNRPKGVERALEIVARLHAQRLAVTLDLVGDGDERPQFEEKAQSSGIANLVRFHGWLPRQAIAFVYASAHILLMPTRSSEGWPKVLSEGMAYGVVPVAGNVSSIPGYLAEFCTGRAIPPLDIDAFVEAIAMYIRDPRQWQIDSENAVAVAPQFTYSSYLNRVQDLLELPRQDISQG